MTNRYLIAGLGNPGKEYEYTRHNLGFLVAKQLMHRMTVSPRKSSLTHGFTAKCRLDDRDVYILMPLTYMNRSGEAVGKMVNKLELDQSCLLVVTDDIHLGFGQLRIRPKGSSGGHNGLRSVSESLHSEAFARLRLGVGKPSGGTHEEAVDYVLGTFSSEQRGQLDEFVDRAVDCCISWIQEGTERTMDRFNRK